MIHRTLLEIDNPSRHPSAYLIVEALVEADLLTYDSKEAPTPNPQPDSPHTQSPDQPLCVPLREPLRPSALKKLFYRHPQTLLRKGFLPWIGVNWNPDTKPQTLLASHLYSQNPELKSCLILEPEKYILPHSQPLHSCPLSLAKLSLSFY
ncbi:MAG: hypothetical protein RIM23_30335 [Coleofasciculus sp. G3-WIS-01]|uniref:hypothetical protein n=1 Tax=Coleofasciculus sp. G3-WIS-01 TaxID=3069528 RepID=UPI0032FFDD33